MFILLMEEIERFIITNSISYLLFWIGVSHFAIKWLGLFTLSFSPHILCLKKLQDRLQNYPMIDGNTTIYHFGIALVYLCT